MSSTANARLPYAALAHVDREKIDEYLLNPAKSRGKAEFFLRFGFSSVEWQRFAAALIEHGRACHVANRVESEYGTRYSVDGPIATPSGRTPLIRTVWIVEHGKRAPRLITAHPIKETS